MAGTIKATTGRKFSPPTNLRDDVIDIESIITTYIIAVTATASEILGKDRHRKKPWVTRDLFDLCDKRRDLEKRRYEE